MRLRLTTWCVALGLVGAVAWPRDIQDDPLDDSLDGLAVGALTGLVLGGLTEFIMARKKSPETRW